MVHHTNAQTEERIDRYFLVYYVRVARVIIFERRRTKKIRQTLKEKRKTELKRNP